MNDTPMNDKLTAQAVGCSDALHLVLVDELSRTLECELAAVKQELAEARRQAEVLVSMAMSAPCRDCEAEDFCDKQPAATTCEETIASWAAQQAKEGGGK